ncbi:hypothetical protein BD410DRAFT_553454 [Rickenella mellea]|uniref:Uncharacterized protein n=1 Tax=Rickenella mellea TaxID=50990 RepID=A0A4Y7PQJ4_9AGAM|nr:hypothetical protein BD410DRAFT_553454 [Rickenella mellea]
MRAVRRRASRPFVEQSRPRNVRSKHHLVVRHRTGAYKSHYLRDSFPLPGHSDRFCKFDSRVLKPTSGPTVSLAVDTAGLSTAGPPLIMLQLEVGGTFASVDSSKFSALCQTFFHLVEPYILPLARSTAMSNEHRMRHDVQNLTLMLIAPTHIMSSRKQWSTILRRLISEFNVTMALTVQIPVTQPNHGYAATGGWISMGMLPEGRLSSHLARRGLQPAIRFHRRSCMYAGSPRRNEAGSISNSSTFLTPHSRGDILGVGKQGDAPW